jgi:hypothetical protein
MGGNEPVAIDLGVIAEAGPIATGTGGMAGGRGT